MKKKRDNGVAAKTNTLEVTPTPWIIPPESGRRISYEPGCLFWYRDQPVQIEAQGPGGFEVRLLRSGGTASAKFHELEPLSVGSVVTSPSVTADMSDVPDSEWARARALEAALLPLLNRDSVSGVEEAQAAAAVGLTPRQLRRWRARYEKNPTLSALLRSPRGRRKGATRLIPEPVELLMREAIRRELKVSPDISVDALVTLIQRQCRMAGLRAPGRTTTALRLRELRAKPANLPAGIGAEISYRQAPVQGSLLTTEPLEVVQIDHTVCDMIVLDSDKRKPIGRPVLTLAIDVHTRVILGMLLSLEAPSSLSVGLCLQHTVFPKDQWLGELGVASGTWPGFGVPRVLQLDNGKEFHAQALERGCERYRIELIYRPVGDPKFGGAIERVIGTFMGKVRLIPGATFNKILKDRPRKTERLARFTMQELYQYFAGEVAQYHLRRHRTLGISPRSAWERAWGAQGRRCYPDLPENAASFLVQFLPLARRVVGRDGIPLFGLRYQSTALHPLIQPRRKRPVRYDPRNLSTIYVEGDDHKSHLVVPLINPELPPLSIWEWREIRARRLVPLYPHDAHVLETALVRNRQMVHAGTSRRGQRRNRRQERERHWRATEPILVSSPAADSDPLKTVSRVDEGPYTCDVLE